MLRYNREKDLLVGAWTWVHWYRHLSVNLWTTTCVPAKQAQLFSIATTLKVCVVNDLLHGQPILHRPVDHFLHYTSWIHPLAPAYADGEIFYTRLESCPNGHSRKTPSAPSPPAETATRRPVSPPLPDGSPSRPARTRPPSSPFPALAAPCVSRPSHLYGGK